jgi:hypothetical protein
MDLLARIFSFKETLGSILKVQGTSKELDQLVESILVCHFNDIGDLLPCNVTNSSQIEVFTTSFIL